jgi:hypothetical protein
VIGVLSKPSEQKAVEEFFQLFKTPWEYYVHNREYDVVLATDDCTPIDLRARVLILYSSRGLPFDERIDVRCEGRDGCEYVKWNDIAFPLYGEVAALHSAGDVLLTCGGTSTAIGKSIDGSEYCTVRMGFDLFSEVAYLLNHGQPRSNAHIPTLDIHISLLRSIIAGMGVRFVEVPPVPAGYSFIACLTHDVDFVGIRDHFCDHTMLGFLYRALLGSFLRALTGKLTWSSCMKNWAAAASLPLVWIGVCKDFWLEFERYLEIERDLRPTFFFVPFQDHPGTLNMAPAPKRRAVKYDVSALREQVLKLAQNGCEIGLHGIDAWFSLPRAQAETERIREITRQPQIGTRMHWLYWAENSPGTLEDAGVAYDSTLGYNDAIGFRSGTTQVFCPYGADSLLELPLNIQDSAMLYPDRMGLSEVDALRACKGIIDSVRLYGGALTLNWHTRSLSPERLWEDLYLSILGEIEKSRVWFGTGLRVVEWFRARRALRFDSVEYGAHSVRVALSGLAAELKPSITVRLHEPKFESSEPVSGNCRSTYTDVDWNGSGALEISYSVSSDIAFHT